MKSSLESPGPIIRDARIDLLRGLALVWVWIDHFEALIGVSLLSGWTLHAWGPSDAAELFVLLSGFVVGWAYARRLTHGGFRVAAGHALRRTLVLYVVLVMASVVLLWLTSACGLLNHPELIPSQLAGADLPTAWLEVARLTTAPQPLRILLLYLVLLPTAPAILMGLRRRPLVVFTASAVLYLATQFILWGDNALRWPWRQGWYFDPLAWQALYAIGLWWGLRRWDREQPSARLSSPSTGVTRSAWRLLAVGLLLAGYFVRPAAFDVDNVDWFSRETRNTLVLLTGKSSLAPLRLVHALAVGAVLYGCQPKAWRSAVPGLLSPLVDIGRRPLLVYVVGSLLLPPMAGLAQLDHRPLFLLTLQMNGLLTLWLLTKLPGGLRRRQRGRSPQTPHGQE